MKPLMVMAVGNAVEGDSRVEKTAVSARNHGFDVVVVGVKQRDVSMFGSYEGIPIYRLVPDWTEYLEWRRHQPKEELAAEDFVDQENEKIREETNLLKAQAREKLEFAQSLRSLPRLVAPKLFSQRTAPTIDWDQKLAPVYRGLTDVREGLVRARVNVGNYKEWLMSGQPGKAIELWPQIGGFEALFLRAFRELQPDIIHVHDRHPMSAAKIYQLEKIKEGIHVPWIYDAHEYLAGQRFSGPARHRYGWLALESEMIQYADHVITVSEQLAAKLQERHHLTRRPSVVVNAPSGVRSLNPDAGRTSLRAELGLKDEPLIVYVGKLAERRGILTAVEAMKYLPGVHLAFVGSKDVAPRAQITDLAKKHKISDRVHIVDYVPSKHVTSYISSADIGLSPLFGTKAHHQALATKIREYLQAGLPIVASDLQAQGTFIRENKVGAVHEERDPKSMADAVREVLVALPRYRQRVDEVRVSHSWEQQELILGQIWRSMKPVNDQSGRELTPPPTHVVPPFRRQMRNRVYPLLRLAEDSDYSMAFAFKSNIYLQISTLEWKLLGHATGAADKQLHTWTQLLESADALVMLDYDPIFEDVIGPATNLKHQLERSGITLYSFVSYDELTDPFEEMALFPGTHWESLDESLLVRISKRRAAARAIVKERGAVVLTTTPETLKLDLPVHWIPNFDVARAKVAKQDLSQIDPIRIGILAGSRPQPVLAALNEMKQGNPFFEFVDVHAHNGSAMGVSLLIDRIGQGFHSAAALSAMKEGIPVLASYDPKITEKMPTLPPYTNVSLATLMAQVRSVANSLLVDSSGEDGLCGDSTQHKLEFYMDVLSSLSDPFVAAVRETSTDEE